jgi:magnesium transporter
MCKEPMWVAELDFHTRVDRQISPDEVRPALERGSCCWIDIELQQLADAETELRRLGLNDHVIADVLSGDSGIRYSAFDNCIHVVATEPTFAPEGLEFSRVDLIFSDRLLVTIRRDKVQSLHRARQNYRAFFREHAKSIGFLAFEVWDGIAESYQDTFVRLEEGVESARDLISVSAEEAMFSRISNLTRNLLTLRRNLIANREILQQLAIHKSVFVTETTQPYLAKLAERMERLSGDVAIEREILTETLTLYLGIATHRTNRILSRLTVISVIFLPLTFLVGLYGMNFESQPEFGWTYGYAFFWSLAGLILLASAMFIRTKHWFT